jgi:hypothetical protein
MRLAFRSNGGASKGMIMMDTHGHARKKSGRKRAREKRERTRVKADEESQTLYVVLDSTSHMQLVFLLCFRDTVLTVEHCAYHGPACEVRVELELELTAGELCE